MVLHAAATFVVFNKIICSLQGSFGKKKRATDCCRKCINMSKIYNSYICLYIHTYTQSPHTHTHTNAHIGKRLLILRRILLPMYNRKISLQHPSNICITFYMHFNIDNITTRLFHMVPPPLPIAQQVTINAR